MSSKIMKINILTNSKLTAHSVPVLKRLLSVHFLFVNAYVQRFFRLLFSYIAAALPSEQTNKKDTEMFSLVLVLAA